jgi:hypothetical protein
MSNVALRMTGASSADQMQERIKVLDGFATPEIAVYTFLEREKLYKNVWEMAAGMHDIVNPLASAGHNVFTSDIYRWHPQTQVQRDFCKFTRLPYAEDHDLFSNPPFRQADDFVVHAHKLMQKDAKLALLLRLQYLEGVARKLKIYDRTPPYMVYVYSFRLPRMHRFHYTGKRTTSVVCFAWFCWYKGWNKSTEIRWIGKPQ